MKVAAYIIQRGLTHHQAHFFSTISHELYHMISWRPELIKSIKTQSSQAASLPSDVLPIDGKYLVSGHQFVHAGAPACHEPEVERIVNN